MPRAAALWFIASTNAGSPPGWWRPSALAARFSDDISARCIISPRVSWVPTARRERLPFSVSMSSWLMVSTSSREALDSATTRPVISLVMEAIGSTAPGFLLNSTSLVSWSITRATLDFRSSGSPLSCKPSACPKLGLAGTTCCTATRRVCDARTATARCGLRALATPAAWRTLPALPTLPALEAVARLPSCRAWAGLPTLSAAQMANNSIGRVSFMGIQAENRGKMRLGECRSHQKHTQDQKLACVL